MDIIKREKLTEEQKKLIEDNINFCYHWMNLHNITDEDKQQHLFTAVCEFIYSFDPSRGKITTFLTQVLESKVKGLTKYENRQKRIVDKFSVGLEDTIGNKDESGDNFTLEDVVEYFEDGFEWIETKDYYDKLLKYAMKFGNISQQNIEMLKEYMETENTQKIAQKYGYTNKRLGNMCRALKSKLKMCKEEYDKVYCK